MKQLNFDNFKNVSNKDKKILNAIYNILSKKYDDIGNARTFEMLEFLISKLCEKMISPYILLGYLYKLKFNIDYLLLKKKLNYPVDSLELYTDYDESYFDYYYLPTITTRDSFFKKISACFETVLNDPRDDGDTYFILEPVQGERIFPFRARILRRFGEVGNPHLFFNLYVSIQYVNKTTLVITLSVGTEHDQKFKLSPFWDTMENINEESLVNFICNDLKPIIMNFLIEYINKTEGLNINENNNIIKYNDMGKIIKLTESDLERIIEKIMETENVLEGKKKAGTKLCSRGKAAAKSKFKVYPSAYANGYAVQVCKGTKPGLDGKKRCSPPYC